MTAERDRIAEALKPLLRNGWVSPLAIANALIAAGCRMPEPPREHPGACNRVMARATAARCCLTPGHDGGCW